MEKTIHGVKVCRSTQVGDLSHAERVLAMVTEEIRNRVVFGERETHTLEEAAVRYIEENRHKRGIARQGYALKPLVERFGDVPVGRISAELLDGYAEGRGVSATTVKREFGALLAVLGQCATQWRDGQGRYWLDKVPALPKLALNPRKPRPITRDEQARLFALLPGYLASMALFAVNTGCRDQEVCGLRWEWEMEVSGLGRSVFVIPGSATKNGRDKIVPLNRVAMSVVESERGKSPEHVFTLGGGRLSRMNNRAWKQARAKAGLKEVRVHDLRHTFAMRLRATGASHDDIADLLGYSRGTVTAHYSRATLEKLIECVDKLANEERKAELVLVRKIA